MRNRILTTIFIAVAAVSAASAQPRALGIRVGVSGLEADYQHDIEAEKYNRPIEREINRLWTEIRNMILELKAV